MPKKAICFTTPQKHVHQTAKRNIFLHCCEPVLFCAFVAQNRVQFAWAKSKGMYMLCSGWNCSFFVSMRLHDLHCRRHRANFAQNLLFSARHSMREASRMKLQFLR